MNDKPRAKAEAVVDQHAEQAAMGDLSHKTWRRCVSSRAARLAEEDGGIPRITR